MSINPFDPYDIFSAESQRNHDVYDRMRTEAPIHKAIHPITGETHWFLTRYNDCLMFLKDKRFTRERHTVSPNLPKLTKADIADSIVNQHMLVLDDPSHSRLKSLVHVAFTPLNIALLRNRFQVIANDLFDLIDNNIGDGDEFNLTHHYIEPLPLLALAELLAVTPENHLQFHHWVQGMLSPQRATANQAIREFSIYLDAEITLLQQHPPVIKTLLAGLVFAERDGDRLNRDELLAMIYLLATAGYETMVNFITNSVLSLLENPEQLDLLRFNLNNHDVVKSAIEELLRYNGPSHMTLEAWAAEDIRMDDMLIHQGDTVQAVLLAANHDPHIFTNPHTLDIFRQPNRHIAFSYGIHHCLGAALARMQGDIAITTLLRRMPNL